MDLITQRINACREAMQKAVLRAERIQALQRLLEHEEKERLQDDHIALDMPFFTEREN